MIGQKERAQIQLRVSKARSYNRRAKSAVLTWQQAHPERLRSYNLKHLYGISLTEIDELYRVQKGRCAICGEPFKKTPEVDHDHGNKQIRGLLCHRCNWGIGIFHEDIDMLDKAVRYLLKWRTERSSHPQKESI
jgi:hypothetical protein